MEGQNVCGDFLENWSDDPPVNSVPIDPQIGWEQQKFLIAMSLLYLPENQKQNWIDQFMIYELGRDADPTIENRIELHYPDGRIYVAHTFGKEDLFGKTVQKGIAARVLEYANELLNNAYETEPVDPDDDGIANWYEPITSPDGQPIVKFDPDMESSLSSDPENCNETTNSGCTCGDNRACMALKNYMSVPAFLLEAIRAYHIKIGNIQGLYY